MIEYLRRLVDERTTLTEAMTGVADTAAREERDMTDTERTTVTNMQARCIAIDEQISSGQSQIEATRSFAALMARADGNAEPVTEHRGGGTRTMERAALSPGAAFVESDAFTEYRGHGSSRHVDVEGFLETRAPITTATLDIEPFHWRPVEYTSSAPLLDVIGHVRVSSGVVEWVEIGGDPEAAVVAEGAPKPEAAFTYTPKSAALDTLAHWVQITRQALEDAPYIRSVVEGKLRRGLLAKAEADAAAVLAGLATPVVDGATLLNAIRNGIGEVESNGYRPNAVILNPSDFAALDVDVMGQTQNGPARSQTFWGLTAVAAASIPAGTAYVGDMQQGITMFDRGVTSVFLTDSHGALFISNILVLLAETRVKTAITDSLAIVKVAPTVVP